MGRGGGSFGRSLPKEGHLCALLSAAQGCLERIPVRDQMEEGLSWPTRGCRHEEEQGGKKNEEIKLLRWKGTTR